MEQSNNPPIFHSEGITAPRRPRRAGISRFRPDQYLECHDEVAGARVGVQRMLVRRRAAIPKFPLPRGGLADSTDR